MKTKTLTVYRKPAEIKPIVKGTERGALHKNDWQSNLGFRFLKGTLAENVATGATSNIHSFDPVPAYVHGAEFGMGQGGRF